MDILKRDARFRVLHDALDPPGEVPDEAPDPSPGRMEAAVSLIIRATEPLELLIVKRSTY
ncbi:MAG: hypothetical protein GWO00_15760, partial [Gemmatimonadetes bacterium]|nr:hypothetical protein [Gemmatimonadota bacterium]NIR79762.1 hypothetical protein [Gemmatimonadota bacterium]NIT88458.1 hypothetical protein [Gemmatimonadota bacterium]NIU32281.1 hypothetical protein [Gemmatimonadota bacterium]NIV62653.1 hypothetical protein [Gemmatimonadota bacterium]